MKKIIGILTIAVLGTTMSFAQNVKQKGKSGKQRTQETKQVVEESTEVTPVTKTKTPGSRNHAPGAKMNAKSQNQTSEMDKIVGLNEDQKNKIAVINKEQNEKAKAIRMKYSKDESSDKSVMKTEIKAIQQDRKQRVRQVLTPAQKVKWKEHKQAKKEIKNNSSAK